MTCYVSAALYIQGSMATRGDRPIPRNLLLHWTHHSASLSIEHGSEMTFGALTDVLSVLVAFHIRYGYTEAKFDIIKEGPGYIGRGNVEFRRPNPNAQPERLTSRLTPVPLSNNKTSALLTLPPSPYQVRIPSTPLTLTFSSYGRAVPENDFLTAMLQISLRIIRELQKPGGGDRAMGEDEQWRWGRALVQVFPEREMTWGMLGSVVNGLASFAMRWAWVTFGFEVGLDGVGGVGVGFVGFI